jgi:deazaflavin-dependent oxidoreductase (nitroreductase family)
MPRKIREVHPPRGIMRWLVRLPIGLYRLGLGGLLGKRALMLTHTGRISGLTRRVVLEVVRHEPSSNTFYIASGWGEKADWLQNVLKQPQVIVHSGASKLDARARRIEPEEAEREMMDYNTRHPAALQTLAKVMGYEIDGTDEDARALGRLIPMVALQTQIPSSSGQDPAVEEDRHGASL